MQETTTFLVVGVLILFAACTPSVLGKTPDSLFMIAFAAGLVFAWATAQDSPDLLQTSVPRRLAEFALLMVVPGGGLRSDRPFLWPAHGIAISCSEQGLPLRPAEHVGLAADFAVD